MGGPRRGPVYLVRHGKSEWNVARLTQGETTHPRLTALGRGQALDAAQAIAADLAAAGLRAGMVLTSDLVRAVESAQILVDVLGGVLRHDERLREQHLGDLQGQTYEETFAVAETLDWSDPNLAVPGGESLLQVRDRMAAALASTDPAAVTVIVSHGDAIRTLLAHLSGVEPHAAPWVDVPNGTVLRLDPPNTVRFLHPLHSTGRQDPPSPSAI